MKITVMITLTALIAVSAAWANQPVAGTQVNLTITADNVFWAWWNPTGLTGSSTFNVGNKSVDVPANYIATNWKSNNSIPEWQTAVKAPSFTLQQGENTLLVKAANWTTGSYNPAALLAKITSGTSTINVTGTSTWLYCVDADPLTSLNWSPVKQMGTIETAGRWSAGNTTLAGDFGGTGAQWIWSEETRESLDATFSNVHNPVWFKTSMTAVPEPMSIALGILGLSSVGGFKRLRRK